MRAHVQADAVPARLAFDIADDDLGGTQRTTATHFGAWVLLVGDVLANPLVQFQLEVGTLLPGTDLLALQHFQVVGQTVDDEHVRQLGAQLVVQLGGLAFFADAEELRLLRRVGGEERGVVAALAHGQGDKAFFRKFIFATVGNQHLGGDLGLDLAHALEVVQRQVFHRATALRADDVRAPAELGEAVGQTAGEGVGGIAPQVVLVAVGHVFLIDEGLHRVVFRVVRVAQQKARYGQADVAGVFLLAEALPLGELRAFEVVLEVLQVRQAGEGFQAEEFRTGRGDERGVRHAGHRGDVLQGLDVWSARVEVVVGDQGADRLATELAVLGGVDVLVQAGLHDFRAVFEVIEQVLLGGVEDLQLDVLAEVGAIHQQLEAAPGGFQGLKVRVVQDFVHLPAELGVDLRDHAVDHGLLHRLVFVLRLEQLFDEGRYAALGDVVGLVIGSQFGLGDDAVENAEFGGAVAAFYGCASRAHEYASLSVRIRNPACLWRPGPVRRARGRASRRRKARFRSPCGRPGRCPAGL